MLAEGDYQEAIDEGTEWLKKNRADGDRAERQWVDALVAEAHLHRVSAADRVADYQWLRDRYGQHERYAPLITVALKREAAAAWRDEATPANTVAAYRRFRETYPEAAQVPEARQREVDRAFATTPATVEAQQGFRADYAGWPELAAVQSASRSKEVEAAFVVADGADDLAAWRRFRETYALWPESEGRLGLALDREAELALKEAVAAHSLEALEAVRRTYGQAPWADRTDQAIAALVLEPLLAEVQQGSAPADEALWAFFEAHAGRPGLDVEAMPHRAALKATAIASGRAAPLRLWRLLVPDDPDRPDLLLRERDLAWAEASRADTRAQWASFVALYPEDPRADEAELRAFRLQRLADAEHSWPRAEVAWSRTLPSGEVELVVDVKDCDGQRISGLTREAFEVYANALPQNITDFKALEEDRPLDLVFGIDLSGSMEAEQEAVRQAVMQFAETFRFRGRTTRLGLVTFAEDVVQRRAPTRDIGAFQGWMQAMTIGAGGGFGEDSTHALVVSADLLRSAPGERVVVLLTDEDLQVNRGGMKALNLDGNAACNRLRSTATCIQKCNSAPCLATCYGKLGTAQRNAMNRCLRRASAQLCVAFANWDRLSQALASCVEPVYDESPAAERLAERLRGGAVRPFFVVPGNDQVEARAILGHNGVARRAQGRVLEVPQDATSPAPYVAALEDIADQLSKQYVVRFRPSNAAARQAPPVVLAGYQHAWNTQAPLPGPAVVGLFAQPSTPACPSLLLVLADGVHRTEACATRWAPVALGTLGGPIVQAVAVGGGDARTLLRTADRLVALDAAGMPRAVATPLTRLDDMAVDGEGGVWLLGQGAGGQGEVHRQAAPDAEFEVVDRWADTGPAVFLEVGAERTCVLLAPHQRRCATAGGRWVDLGVAGLPEDALQGTARALAVPGRRGTVLLATATGALWRSLDGGGLWRLVYPAAPDAAALQPPSLVWLAGSKPTICASGPSSVACSVDLGRTWSGMGRAFDERGRAALALVGADLYLGRDAELHRLDRVVTRDIPSSAVYFGTDQDSFDPRMGPFLSALAQRMAADPALTLRVEGHADYRGGDVYNDDLALRRAAQVAAAIAHLGVDAARVVTLGFGSRRPVRAGKTPDDLARNRRVELVLTRPEPVIGQQLDQCGRLGARPAVEPERLGGLSRLDRP